MAYDNVKGTCAWKGYKLELPTRYYEVLVELGVRLTTSYYLTTNRFKVSLSNPDMGPH